MPYRFVSASWFIEYRHPTKDIWWPPEEAYKQLEALIEPDGDMARVSELVQS